MMEVMVQVIEVATRIVEFLGIGVIFWGVGVGLVGFVSAQLPRNNGTSPLHAIIRVRGKLGVYLLLGLEILIASDIAATVIEPTYEKIILLGGIVAIRTILSLFLSRELKEIGLDLSGKGAERQNE